MSKKPLLLAGVVALVFGLSLLGGCIPSPSGGDLNLDALETFRAEDLNGKVWDLEKMKGQVVLVDFWATWCGPCIQEMPYLKTAYERHHADGFEILAISLDDGDRKGFREFLGRSEIKWPQIHEGIGFDSSIARDFGVSSIPRSFLLNREGEVVGTNLRGPHLIRAVEKAVRQ